VPEHQPTAVQSVRPDGHNGRPGGLQVPGRGSGAARSGADQRLEGARPTTGAHRAGHSRGHVERQARPPPTADHAADRRPDIGGRAVAVLHRRVVGVASADGHHAGGRAVADRRTADAVQRHQLVRGGHDHGRVEDRQVRHGLRHRGYGWHTGNASLRVRSGQHGFRRRLRDVHRPGPNRDRVHVYVDPRQRHPTAVKPERRQSDGHAPQLLPRADQTTYRPRQADPVSNLVRVCAAHVRANRR